VDVPFPSLGLGRRKADARSQYGFAHGISAHHLHYPLLPLFVEASAPHPLMIPSEPEGHAKLSAAFLRSQEPIMGLV
jgi:hypothetical protein